MRVRLAEGVPFLEARLPEAIARFTASGDDAGLAQAYLIECWLHWLRSRAAPARRAIARAAEHARRAGDRALLMRSIAPAVGALIFGPASVDEMRHALEDLRTQGDGPYMAAMASSLEAEIARLDGRLDDSVAALAIAAEHCDALGLEILRDGIRGSVADVEEARGDLAAAIATLDREDEALARHGEVPFRSTVIARRALLHAKAGDYDAARADGDLAEQLSVAEDVVNFAFVQAARARVAAHGADPAAAEPLARDAVRHAFATDFPGTRAEALLALGEALAATGRREEAAAELERAVAIQEAKGDRPGTERARSAFARLHVRDTVGP
jgi:tetratricopeptide (TPR) repeat protein